MKPRSPLRGCTFDILLWQAPSAQEQAFAEQFVAASGFKLAHKGQSQATPGIGWALEDLDRVAYPLWWRGQVGDRDCLGLIERTMQQWSQNHPETGVVLVTAQRDGKGGGVVVMRAGQILAQDGLRPLRAVREEQSAFGLGAAFMVRMAQRPDFAPVRQGVADWVAEVLLEKTLDGDTTSPAVARPRL